MGIDPLGPEEEEEEDSGLPGAPQAPQVKLGGGLPLHSQSLHNPVRLLGRMPLMIYQRIPPPPD